LSTATGENLFYSWSTPAKGDILVCIWSTPALKARGDPCLQLVNPSSKWDIHVYSWPTPAIKGRYKGKILATEREILVYS